ncbi:uncharacterized protein B0I36DRAFT_317499 [Microdochium trichocladiopsis]|uniref:Pentatricopeptide repeat protein n=1 Tax=Microdochium trichocladiopsis TaxID=1682393 RepID=A0A9P8YAY3_9PEZI|nr:uncharacterized protein B0I36DRAFT_317499 [Microdochium trichocladiopsis]KAH7035046.1 hypothetical protein B0I36DRAFT_317499 [Microdochium trichocladiopsis]
MPPRSVLVDFSARDFICRSCRLGLQKPRALPRWTARPAPSRVLARQSSNAAIAQPKPPPNTTSAGVDPSSGDDERRELMQALGLLDDEKTVRVNYFEQDKSGGVRRLASAEAFGDSLHGDLTSGAGQGKVEDMIQQLEEASRLFKLLEQVGGKDQVAKLKKRLAEDLVEVDEDESETSLELPGHITETILIKEEGWAGPDVQRISRLNRKLKRVAHLVTRRESDISEHQRSALWKGYMNIRKALVSRRNAVPPAAWDLLWRALASEREDNPNRIAHIAVLARDMQNTGATLSDEQQLLAIEAMFIDGHEKEAFDNHRRLVTTLGARKETALDFWQLGLRMYCLVGDLERAERAVENIAELPGSKDPRFLLPFIRACAENPASVEVGYDAYRRMRDMLGAGMNIEDYDQVIAYFLASDQTDHALYIFVDMMSSGSTNIKDTRKLPTTIANPFFFGKWIKRLIGLGEVENAHKVFLLMINKGIIPRPVQVNGLLGAWLRSDSAHFMAQADSVAWEMINARIQFVQLRKQAANFGSNVHLSPSGTGWPSATLETFSLLADSYNQRGLHAKMEDLWKAFRQAEMAPDAFMMNQLLFSYIKDGQGRQVADLYHALTDEYAIKPDPLTFRALWMAIPANRLYTIRKREYQQEIPHGRTLFAEMVQFTSAFEHQEFDYQLARKIAHSFRKLDDKVGLLLAVRGLRQVFGFYPPEPLVLELLADTVDLERMSKSPRARNGLLRHTQRMDRFLEDRRLELVKAGALDSGAQLSTEARREALSRYLEGQLQESCNKSNLYPQGVESAEAEAATQMGLVDLLSSQ